MNKSRGFTLIELLVTIAILAVLATLAIPSYRDFIEKSHLRGAAEAVYEQLQYARAQALKRSIPIIVDFSADGSTAWALGVTDNLNGCDAAITTTVDGDSDGVEDNGGCTINYDNDLGIDHPGVATPSDLVLTRVDGTNDHGVKMKGGTALSFVGTPGACVTAVTMQACFEPIQGLARETKTTAPTGHIQLESDNYKLQVRVYESGEVKVCVPPLAIKFLGYEDC